VRQGCHGEISCRVVLSAWTYTGPTELDPQDSSPSRKGGDRNCFGVRLIFANVGTPRATPVAGPSGELTNVYSPVGTLKRYDGRHRFLVSAVIAWEAISIEDEDKSPVRRDTVKWIG
jgi:hypothetical protein